MKKNFIFKCVSTLLIIIMLASLAACEEPDKPTGSDKDKNEKKTLTFWYFNKDEGNNLVKEFEDKNPDYKIKMTITLNDNNTYETKVTPLINSKSGNIPDVFAGESAYIKKFVDMPGGFCDLTKAPFNVTSDTTKDMYEYAVGVGKDSKGVIRALAHQTTPNGLGFKRELTKKYLGTDDPAEISKMMATQEKIIETGEKLKDGATLFSGVDDMYRLFFGLRKDPWVVNNKLVIDPEIENFVKFAKTIRNKNLDSKVPQQWQGPWDKAIADQKTVFFPICTWGVPYIIGRDRTVVDQGKWGIAQTEKATAWGGTWFGIAEKCKDKKGAWKFLQSITLDKETMEARAKKTGDLVNNKSINDTLAADATIINKTINQNPFKIFAPLAEKIDGKLITKYDSQCETEFLQLVKDYLDNKTIKDEKELIKQFKEKMKNNLKDTDIKVD